MLKKSIYKKSLSSFLVIVFSIFSTSCLSDFIVNNPESSSSIEEPVVIDPPVITPPPVMPPPVTPPPVTPPPVTPPVTPPPVTPPPVTPPPVTPPPQTMVPVFMFLGHQKSTMYSCDGQAWRGYRTGSNQRCWSSSDGDFDCDHAATSALGITYGNNRFMATYGWGRPGQVEASLDGNNWTTVQTGGTWAGVAYGNSTFILNERSPLISSNNGGNWSRGGDINFSAWNARRIHFVNLNGGFFISQAESSGAHDLMISRNNGTSFSRPATLPARCGTGDIAFNTSNILLLSQDLCRSSDNGLTWQSMPTKPPGGNLIYDGSEFKVFDYDRVYRSANGSSWTSTPILRNGSAAIIRFEKVAYHPNLNRYVGIAQGWQSWYEQTQYYHSTDGINWMQINKSLGTVPNAPHPVRQVITGFLPAASCN